MKMKRFFCFGLPVFLLALSVVLAGCGGKKESGGGSAARTADRVKQAADELKNAAGGSSGAKPKEAEASDFIYELNEAGDGVRITGIQADAKFGRDLVIPAAIEGYPVVEYSASYSNAVLASVVFSDSITKITTRDWWDPGVFVTCGNLTSITLPKNLKELPKDFATGCSNLTTITWPENLEIIGEGAFDWFVLRDGSKWDGAGFTELVIPEGVKEIRSSAFRSCKKLVSVTIPASVEYIDGGAFADCPALTTVNMPAKTIKYMSLVDGRRMNFGSKGEGDNDAFRGCPKLTGIAMRKAIQDTGYTGEF
jgi:hypothetical protein